MKRAEAVQISPRALTPLEAAVYIGVSRTTLQLMRSQGMGPRFFKIGEDEGGIRYDLRDLDRWIDERPRFPRPQGIQS